jgi:glucose/arabinose dehydrogenase
MISPDGTLSAPLDGVPKVDARGQGGLLDVALHPDFAKNAYVYLTFSEPGSAAGTNGTAVARGKLVESNGRWSLSDTTIIFRQAPKYASSLHFGSRLVFARDGNLFVTLGERSSHSVEAQNPASHLGKVVRITDQGKVPEGNPMVATAGAFPEIWSMGHRNPQGAALNPATGELWVAEHGPQGGDEINIVKAGGNYGWPKFTYGERYGGGKIGEQASTPGYTPPIYSWVPSVSPSGIAFYSSNSIPQWQGSLLVGALSGQALIRLQLDGNRVVKEERLLADQGMRIRDVQVGAQGEVYLLTDAAQGRVLRLSPRPR